MVDVSARTLLIVGLAFTSGATLIVLLQGVWVSVREQHRRRTVAENLARLTAAPTGTTPVDRKRMLREELRYGDVWMPSWLRGSRIIQRVEDRVAQAALQWSPQVFLAYSAACAAGGGLCAIALAQSSAGMVLGSIGGFLLPYFYLGHQRSRRMRLFEEQFPEALDLLSRALRAGHPIATGLNMVAEEMPEPIASEFRYVFEGQRYGLAFDESMREMTRRIPLMDVQIFTMAVLIQREIGGNLSEILDKLSVVIRQRFSLRRELRTHTAQGRMSGYVLGALPVVMGLVLYAMNPGDMIAFVQHPLGRVMIAGAATMQLVGFLWIRNITHLEI